MIRRKWLAALGCVVSVAVFSGQAMSQEKPAKPADKPAAVKPTDKAAAKPHEGTPSQGDIMAELAKLAQPGPQHKALQPLIGTFTCDVKFWMQPGAEPDVSSGTVTRKWILGDRYLVEDYEGTAGGMPFKGHGILAYNNAQQRYESTWIDSMSTGIHQQTGKPDATGKTITFESENYCPIEKKMKHGRTILEITSSDKSTMKMYAEGPDGKEFLGMDMVCTRK